MRTTQHCCQRISCCHGNASVPPSTVLLPPAKPPLSWKRPLFSFPSIQLICMERHVVRCNFTDRQQQQQSLHIPANWHKKRLWNTHTHTHTLCLSVCLSLSLSHTHTHTHTHTHRRMHPRIGPFANLGDGRCVTSTEATQRPHRAAAQGARGCRLTW